MEKATVKAAKEVMDKYLSCYDLYEFAIDVSSFSARFGRFGVSNRLLFLEALREEIRKRA